MYVVPVIIKRNLELNREKIQNNLCIFYCASSGPEVFVYSNQSEKMKKYQNPIDGWSGIKSILRRFCLKK